MKIAITADIHLAQKSDFPERYNALENILEQVETDKIENLIVAGDLFDRDFQNYSEFESLCKKHPKIQLHVIPGNHDAGISDKDIVGPNIQIYTSPTAVEVGSTTFLFIPYKEKSNMGEQIAGSEKEIGGKEWVLIGHGDYYGGVKELNPLEPGTYMPLSRENVAAFNPRAVFLGHIHKPINWSNVYYAGSPCGLDINETGRRRLLVYDTADGSVTHMLIATDVIYFKEAFIVVPVENEVDLLTKEIFKRIESWNLDPSEYQKVIVRVEAMGYATDRSAIFTALKKGFDKFKYYYSEGPLIDKLSISADRQLNAVAERTISLIDELDWDYGGDEPDRDSLKMAALNVIYGN